jgi:uncharacterized membrane protein
VGDAAGFFDPFTGEGIYRALVGAEIGSSVVHAALARGDTSRRSLKAYDHRRTREFRRKEIVTAIVQLFVQYPSLMKYALPRLAERSIPADTLGSVLGDVADAKSFLNPPMLWSALRPWPSNPAMLRTHNSTVIKAPLDVVFHLARGTDRWPQILRHYRAVHFLGPPDPRECRAFMAARHHGIPVSWTSIQTVDESGKRVLYRHIGGITRGMQVEWRVEHAGEGILVTITHELPSPQGLLRFPPARLITGFVFVRGIADRTLKGIKQEAEKQAALVRRWGAPSSW